MILPSTHKKIPHIPPHPFTRFFINLGHTPDCAVYLHMDWSDVYSPRTALSDFKYFHPTLGIYTYSITYSHTCCRAEQLLLEEGRNFQKAPLTAPMSSCSPGVPVAGRAASGSSQKSKFPALILLKSSFHRVGPENSQVLTFFFKTMMHSFYLRQYELIIAISSNCK